MADRKFILDNIAFRLGLIHQETSINIGYGCIYPKLVVIHDKHHIPERDGTSGALKRFNLSDTSYRMPFEIVQGLSNKDNRTILVEVLEILKPALVVTSGKEATEFLRNKGIRSFAQYLGKEFVVDDLTNMKFYAILNPEEYSFARAPQTLKEQGRQEWEQLTNHFHRLTSALRDAQWKV